MKIIIINGSPRLKGSTARILTVMGDRLRAKGDVEVVFRHLSELGAAFCKGCCSCFQTGKCSMDDDLEKLSNEITEADGIIIGSPTYASNISGQLKTFVDRGHLIIEQALHEKYAIGVITSENYGGSAAAKILKNIFSYSGASVSALLKHKLPFSNAVALSDASVARLEKCAERLYRDIEKKRVYVCQKLWHGMIFNFGIKSFVKRKGEAYRGVAARWKSKGIPMNTGT